MEDNKLYSKLDGQIQNIVAVHLVASLKMTQTETSITTSWDPESQRNDVTCYKFSPLYVEVKLVGEETSLFPVWFVEWHL